MIYTNPNTEVLSEDAQIFTEGFTINKNPPDDFYKIALDIIVKIGQEVGKLPAENLFNKGRKMDEVKSFSRSVDRAIQGIEFNKKYKKRTRFSISIPITSLSLGEDNGSTALFNAVGNPIVNNGFQVMKESKKFLKKLFQTIYLYRNLSDKSFMVMTYSISYLTNYGCFAGWSTIKLSFKAVVNDERALKALNIIESGNIEHISEGILSLTKEERDGLEKIKDTIKRLFRKRDKPNTKHTTQKNKTIPLERKLFDEYKDKIFKELKNICKKYNDKDIHPEILECDNFGIIYIIFHKDQEFNMSNRDLLYEIADELEKTEIYKDISESVTIDIGFGDGDEGCLYIDIFNILKESAIFESVEFI